MSMPGSALHFRCGRARELASDGARDRHSKRTSSPRIANSPATTLSAFFRGEVTLHSLLWWPLLWWLRDEITGDCLSRWALVKILLIHGASEAAAGMVRSMR